jgi:hypothetical protein
VTSVFGHPFLVEDMACLLVGAGTGPIPLRRGDDKPFSRFSEEISAMLLTLPDWLEGFTGLAAQARIGLALQALRLTGLVAMGATGALAPLPKGREWLGMPLSARTATVREALKPSADGAPLLIRLMEEEWMSGDGAGPDVFSWLVQAFSCVPVSTFIRVGDFTGYQAAIGSPLAWPPGSDGQGALSGTAGLATEEALEELWKSFLGVFLGRCLLSLGGAEAGVTSDGRPGFRLTDAGRSLLGLPREGRQVAEEPAANTEAQLVVQPNFEIVFLSPSPPAEAELGRCCERVGREVGVLFRITRASLRRARDAGLTAGHVLSVLSAGSRNPLPSNVEHEIAEWMTPADTEGT